MRLCRSRSMFSTHGGPTLIDEDDSREAVSVRLRAVREEVAGLNKRQFAQRAGISPQYYGEIENCQRDLSIEAAKKLRSTYSLPLEFMYFGKMDDLPHRIATAVIGSPSVKSTQKSMGNPEE